MKTMTKRPVLDKNKISKLKTSEQYFTQKYGANGTAEREAFKAKAQSWYFAEVLKEERKERKMTQSELAEKIGKKREYISQLENGKIDMQLSTFISILQALGLKLTLS